MGSTSFWTCVTILLCEALVAWCQHENPSRGNRQLSSQSNSKNFFGSKLIQKLSDGNCNKDLDCAPYQQEVPPPPLLPMSPLPFPQSPQVYIKTLPPYKTQKKRFSIPPSSKPPPVIRSCADDGKYSEVITSSCSNCGSCSECEKQGQNFQCPFDQCRCNCDEESCSCSCDRNSQRSYKQECCGCGGDCPGSCQECNCGAPECACNGPECPCGGPEHSGCGGPECGCGGSECGCGGSESTCGGPDSPCNGPDCPCCCQECACNEQDCSCCAQDRSYGGKNNFGDKYYQNFDDKRYSDNSEYRPSSRNYEGREYSYSNGREYSYDCPENREFSRPQMRGRSHYQKYMPVNQINEREMQNLDMQYNNERCQNTMCTPRYQQQMPSPTELPLPPPPPPLPEMPLPPPRYFPIKHYRQMPMEDIPQYAEPPELSRKPCMDLPEYSFTEEPVPRVMPNPAWKCVIYSRKREIPSYNTMPEKNYHYEQVMPTCPKKIYYNTQKAYLKKYIPLGKERRRKPVFFDNLSYTEVC